MSTATRGYDYSDVTRLLFTGDVVQSIYAIGVVFGDIGTSPLLYTMKEIFNGPHAVPLTFENVLGILSLIILSTFVSVTIKYVHGVNKADNNGEGGTFALFSLIPKTLGGRFAAIGGLMTIIAAAMLCGDAVIHL